MMPMIEATQLGKTYGNGPSAVRALHHVNLQVNAGEMLLLMGPSGSGKTTLLSILGCILRPTEGSLRVDGREVSGLPESRLPDIRIEHFGFVFQGFNLFPALTARENVEIALGLKGVRAAGARRRQAAVLLEQVGLEEKLDAYPAEMSGGQKQRVAIARALAGEPPVLLADEPTAALDSASGRMVMEILSSIAREQNRAVVIVTHDPRVLHYADRIVHIADGRIVGQDNPALRGLQPDEILH